jgi:hypothetical protein
MTGCFWFSSPFGRRTLFDSNPCILFSLALPKPRAILGLVSTDARWLLGFLIGGFGLMARTECCGTRGETIHPSHIEDMWFGVYEMEG